jgi:hypothetical protein
MKTDSAMNNDLTESLFVRVGGLLGFLIVALAFVVNFVLIRPPAEGAAALVQPKAYISDQAGRMAIANGLRNLIFFCVSEQRDVFLALWAVTHVLFSAAPVGTAAMVTGFSLAGWRSGALPTWLVALGFIFAAATIISCVGIVSAMTGGWAAKVMSMFIPLSLVWLLSTSVLMVRRPSA